MNIKDTTTDTTIFSPPISIKKNVDTGDVFVDNRILRQDSTAVQSQKKWVIVRDSIFVFHELGYEFKQL